MSNLKERQPITPIAIALLLAVLLAPAVVAAQSGPIGTEILVGPAGFSVCPAVAMSANGDFEVVWNHYSSDAHAIPQGIFTRHFDREGRPTQEKEIRLDSPKNIEASSAHLVALPGSGYVVGWFEYRRRSRGGTVARFLDSAGRPRSPVLWLSRYGYLQDLIVVGDNLIVAWKDGEEILRARRFDFAGNARGKVMLLSNVGRVRLADLAPLSDSFVAAWERWTGSSWVIEAKRFSLAGERLGPGLRLNNSRYSGQFRVRVASDGNDRFAVAWTTREVTFDPQTGRQVTEDQPRVRFFDASGASSPMTDPTQIHAGAQSATGLAMDSRGLALVTWHSIRNSSTQSIDIAGRFLDPSGQPASEAFPISGSCPDAATSGNDEWVVAWLEERGVFAKRWAFGD